MKTLLLIITLLIFSSCCNKLIYVVSDAQKVHCGYTLFTFESEDEYSWDDADYPANTIIAPDSSFKLDERVWIKRNGTILKIKK